MEKTLNTTDDTATSRSGSQFWSRYLGWVRNVSPGYWVVGLVLLVMPAIAKNE